MAPVWVEGGAYEGELLPISLHDAGHSLLFCQEALHYGLEAIDGGTGVVGHAALKMQV